MVKFKLIPRNDNDVIEIQSQNANPLDLSYPTALVHIDTFWEGHNEDNDLYNLLNDGITVVIGLNIIEEEN